MLNIDDATIDADGNEVDTTLDLLERLLGAEAPPGFAVRLWEGTHWNPHPAAGEPRMTLVLRRPGALRTMLWPPGRTAATAAYLTEDIDFEGPLEEFVALADELRCDRLDFQERLRLGHALRALPQEHRPAGSGYLSLARTFANRWLDRRLLGACVGQPEPTDQPETIRQPVFDSLRRALDLHAGQRMLVIGDAWDGLLLDAARDAGVLALGLPPRPVAKPSGKRADSDIAPSAGTGGEPAAREPFAQAGAESDARRAPHFDIPETFDAVLDIELFAHRGPRWQRARVASATRLLRPRGRCLLYTLVSGERTRLPEQRDWPAEEVGPLSEVLSTMEHAGLAATQLVSRRVAALRTLREELARLEAHQATPRAGTHETSYRLWRLALAEAANSFATGQLDIHQVLLIKVAGRR